MVRQVTFQPPSKRGWSSDPTKTNPQAAQRLFQPPSKRGWSSDGNQVRRRNQERVSTPFKTGMVFRQVKDGYFKVRSLGTFQPPSKRGWSSDAARPRLRARVLRGFNPLQNGDGLPTGVSRALSGNLPTKRRFNPLQNGDGLPTRAERMDQGADQRVSTPFKTGMVFRRDEVRTNGVLVALSFNPFKTGDGLPTDANGWFCHPFLGFNPLQNGDGLPTVRVQRTRRRRRSRFNPLQNGDGLPTHEWKSGPIAIHRFNPLQNGDGLPTLSLGNSRRKLLFVFQPPSKRGWSSDRACPAFHLGRSLGFNPLQNGDGLPTPENPDIREVEMVVSTPFKTGMVFRRLEVLMGTKDEKFQPPSKRGWSSDSLVEREGAVRWKFQPPSKRGWSSDRGSADRRSGPRLQFQPPSKRGWSSDFEVWEPAFPDDVVFQPPSKRGWSSDSPGAPWRGRFWMFQPPSKRGWSSDLYLWRSLKSLMFRSPDPPTPLPSRNLPPRSSLSIARYPLKSFRKGGSADLVIANIYNLLFSKNYSIYSPPGPEIGGSGPGGPPDRKGNLPRDPNQAAQTGRGTDLGGGSHRQARKPRPPAPDLGIG